MRLDPQCYKVIAEMSQKSRELPDNTKRIVVRNKPIAGRPVRTQAQLEADGGRCSPNGHIHNFLYGKVYTSGSSRRTCSGAPLRWVMPLAGGLGGLALAAAGKFW